MKRNVFYFSLLMVIAILFSCENKKVEEKEVSNSETYKGVPITHKYDKKIDSLLSEMTLEEKAGMLHGTSMFATSGVERLGIPELSMADGPLGIREEISRDSWTPAGWDNDFATYYPAAGSVAATWNPKLSYKFGQSVGQEAPARDKDVLLSPAINIIRTPLGGRTYEYFTEDPFLNKKLAVPYVVGLQENNVAACVKHFVANNQETHRDYVDVQIDERALREIYLPAFKAVVEEAKAYSVMGAYNKFRGEYLCENSYMLDSVLRKEWGFEGIVISDWAAVHDTKKALESGTDIEMGTVKPSFDEFYFADPLIKKVKAGEIAEKELDKSVKRILQLMYTINSIKENGRGKGSLSTEAHFQDAYAIASESVVLLKNEGDLLPIQLDGVKSIAVIGNNATKKNALAGFGAGVKTKREVTPLEGLKNKLPRDITINYAEGYLERYEENENAQLGAVTSEAKRTIDKLEPKMLQEALEVVKKSDVAVIFAGSNRDFETESSDRISLHLPFGQEELIQKVLEVNPSTIVVFVAGAPFDIKDVVKSSKAVVWSWFNGSEGGNALADVLLGNVNPSGKLPWTMPIDIQDSPAHATNSFPGDEVADYKEGILVGYRWFDTKNVAPLFPFGYGLSYTDFVLENAKTDKKEYSEDETIEIAVEVANKGKYDGKEVVQVYVSKPDSKIARAAQELKGFQKVFVQSGDNQTAVINIPVKELAYYNVANKKWEVEKGTYTLRVGNSSRNIAMKKDIIIK